MRKLKSRKCLICTKNIGRHDPKRVSIKVGQYAWREAHLACTQEDN